MNKQCAEIVCRVFNTTYTTMNHINIRFHVNCDTQSQIPTPSDNATNMCNYMHKGKGTLGDVHVYKVK